MHRPSPPVWLRVLESLAFAFSSGCLLASHCQRRWGVGCSAVQSQCSPSTIRLPCRSVRRIKDYRLVQLLRRWASSLMEMARWRSCGTWPTWPALVWRRTPTFPYYSQLTNSFDSLLFSLHSFVTILTHVPKHDALRFLLSTTCHFPSNMLSFGLLSYCFRSRCPSLRTICSSPTVLSTMQNRTDSSLLIQI